LASLYLERNRLKNQQNIKWQGMIVRRTRGERPKTFIISDSGQKIVEETPRYSVYSQEHQTAQKTAGVLTGGEPRGKITFEKANHMGKMGNGPQGLGRKGKGSGDSSKRAWNMYRTEARPGEGTVGGRMQY